MRRRLSPPPENMIREHGRVVADAGQGTRDFIFDSHCRPRNARPARRICRSMDCLAFGVGDREIDPAEIDA